MQVKKLVDIRNKYIDVVLNKGNVVKSLNVYVQSNVFCIEHATCIYFIFLIWF